MATSKVWPSTGSTNVTSTSYSIPEAGNVNWASLTDFLVALANGAQSTTFQRFALRVATSSPVTVSANDCVVQTNLTVAGAVAVTLPAGVQKYVYFISDGKGDAGTNNVTITPNAGETIGGAATYVMDTNYEAVMISFQSSDNDWKIIGRWTPNQTISPSSITLANGSILIGNASNVAQARTMSGAITITNAGVTSITAGTIVNADVNATAAIAVSKLAALTASRAVVSDASGFISAATTTSTQIGYLSNVTSDVQAQLDAKTTNPMTTTGDIIYASNTATPATAARLAVGSVSTVLISTGTLPSWGQIVNASVDAAAAIAGTKISPNFGSQNVATTGVYSGGATTITTPGIFNAKQTTSIIGFYVEATNADANVTGVAMKNDAREWRVQVRGDTADDFAILDNTAGSFRLRINSSGVVTFSAYTTGVAHFDASGVISSSLIVNADVDAAAAIAGTKISPNFGSQNIATTGVYSGGATTITTPGTFNAKNASTSITGVYAEATGADSDVTGVRMKNNVRDWSVLVAGSVSDAFLIQDNGAAARFSISSAGAIRFWAYSTGVLHSDSSGNLTSSAIVNADVDASAAIAGSKINATTPTVQFFTSGSAATYTTPAGVKWLMIEMVGGGGGGGCSGTAAGTPATAGGSSIWATSGGVSIITCSGGGAGVFGNTPGAGGTVTTGSGYIGGTLFNGQRGGGAAGATGSATAGPAGGDGGQTPFGGAGGGGTLSQAGLAAAANTGSGGGGGGLGGSGTNFTGSGGSAGGYAKFYITSSIAATYQYTVGAAGTGGTAGTNGFAGGNGAAGFIQVTEFYI